MHPDGRRRVLRFGGALLLAAAGCAGGPDAARAQSHAVDVSQLRLDRADDGLYLSASIGFELPMLVENALLKGIPLFFVAEAEVLRQRWYWSDQRVALSQRHMRLAYLPLTRRWRLNVSPTPIGNASLGVAFGQNFDELSDALDAIKRLSRWRIAEAQQVEPGSRYNVDFSFRLDTTQLPRPLQMGVAGRPDWSLEAERTLPVPPDGAQ